MKLHKINKYSRIIIQNLLLSITVNIKTALISRLDKVISLWAKISCRVIVFIGVIYLSPLKARSTWLVFVSHLWSIEITKRLAATKAVVWFAESSSRRGGQEYSVHAGHG